jgi:hypothetical protein
MSKVENHNNLQQNIFSLVSFLKRGIKVIVDKRCGIAEDRVKNLSL